MGIRATMTTAGLDREGGPERTVGLERLLPPGCPRYAKLTRPRPHEAFARRRLFALLDALRRDHPVLWIAAPPGAGKTTLAASYLAHAGAPSLWCDVDAGDADPATLFFFLDEALRGFDHGAFPRQPGLQAWGQEAGSTARRYFREFYARLPAGAIVVLDNMHACDWENAGELLECALDAVPDGMTLLALGRDTPPVRLARMELGGRLARIGWDALRLDEQEARALARLGGGESGPVPDWLALADGWAAGVVMLRKTGCGADGQGPRSGGGRDAVFRYFAGEIVERLPAASQRLLLLLSCLPGTTAADAAALTGDPGAARLLEDLHARHLFVERRGAAEGQPASDAPSFHFHPLFGEFLRQRARTCLAPCERLALLERAGDIAAAQRIDEAAGLYGDAGAHAALVRLLLHHARAMLAGGRAQAWRLWMSWLSTDVAEAEPWLGYWHGVSLVEVRPLHARRILVRAEGALRQAGERIAGLLAAAAIVDTYETEWSDFSALEGWAARLAEGLYGIDDTGLDPGTDLTLYSRLMVALLHVAPASPLLATCAQRVGRTLGLVDDPVERLGAGACLLRYFDAFDSSARANALVLEMNLLADEPGVSPFHRVRWYGRVARWYGRDGNVDAAHRMACRARRIVDGYGLDPLLFQALEAQHLLGTGELAQARTLLDAVRPFLPASRRLELVEWSALEAQWRALAGDLAGALHAARETLDLSADAGMPAAEGARFEAFLGACHAWAGAFDEATRCYARAARAAFGMHGLLLREERQFIEALACSARGEQAEALALLGAAMTGHRARQATALFPMVPALAAPLAALALEHGVEPAHVRAIVVRQRLAAPHRAVRNWPWQVAVRTLGPFELALCGELVSASGKAQQRPLALLKNLVAAGEGGKTQGTLVAQLWGDADIARSALNVTVHRLRKLLGSDDAIVVAGGRIGLDETKVWSDLAALADLCAAVGKSDTDSTPGGLRQAACALLDLYRGPFCEGSEEGWTLAPRERARSLFLAAVARLGEGLEAACEWQLAQDLYQRALAAEPLAEANYRGWMRCAHASEGAAAAFGAYRRCRETLSIVLGVQPALETEKLAVALGLK